MSADLIAIAVLAAVGLLWAFLNLKIRSGFGKTLTFWLMWAFLLGASLAAVRFAWGVLS